MTNVIPLAEQIKALHPQTKKPVTIVGIEVTHCGPKLIVLHQSFEGIYAEVIDDADLPAPSVAA
ncbi:hypothetical protein AB4144_20125 [Rhizobiaceae sp. 2RAB30]